jgi:hypothetical protein
MRIGPPDRSVLRWMFAGMAAVVLFSGLVFFSARALADAWSDWLAWSAGVYLGDDCDKYAAQAQQDEFFMERMGCAAGDPGDFSGPRWQENTDNHANWCKTATPEAISSEEFERQSLLLACYRCYIYSKLGVDQAATANALKCGFTGAEWSTNMGDQMRACFGSVVPSDLVVDRNDKLKACSAAASNKARGTPYKLKVDSGGPPPRIPRPCTTEPCGSSSAARSSSSSGRIAEPGLLEGDTGFATQGPAAAGQVSRPSRGN